MKTVLQELIEKLNDAQKLIIAKGEYTNGYDGALSDCISVAESFLEKEKEQIIDAVNNGTFINIKGKQYYQDNFDDNPEAGI